MASDFAVAFSLAFEPNWIQCKYCNAGVAGRVFRDIILGSAIRNCEADSAKSAQLTML